MLIQKIFHVHSNAADSKARLSEILNEGCCFEGLEKAVIQSEGFTHLECVIDKAFRVKLDIEELPTEEPNQTLFHSCCGNVDLTGLLEYIEVREHLTEVQLTLEYTLKSTALRSLDALTGCIEHWMNHQLQCLRDHLDHNETLTPHFRPEADVKEHAFAH